MSSIAPSTKAAVSAVFLVLAAALLIIVVSYFILSFNNLSEPVTTDGTDDDKREDQEQDQKQTRKVFALIGFVGFIVLLFSATTLARNFTIDHNPIHLPEYVYFHDTYLFTADQLTSKLNARRESHGIRDRQFLNMMSRFEDYYFVTTVKIDWEWTTLRGPLERHKESEQAAVPQEQVVGFKPVQKQAAPVQVAGRAHHLGNPEPRLTLLTPQDHRTLTWYFGQDAAGVSADKNLFLVADGVGSCPHSELMSRTMVRMVLNIYNLDPRRFDLIGHADALNEALYYYKNSLNFFDGESTLVIAQRCPEEGTVKVWSCGDSRAMIVGRNGKIKLWVKEGQVCFNAPFLAGRVGIKRIRLHTIKYDRGDRLLVMSDGIADNIWPLTLARIENAMEAVELALKQAHDPTAHVPFWVGQDKKGGKKDDMSLIMVSL